MLLEIDTRELRIIERLKASKPDINFSVVPLDVGDFRFSHDDSVIVVIERKTINDLSQSIKDGRYSDQKYRMCDVYERSQLMYIIEGNVFTPFVPDIVKGAVINTLIRDDIKIVPVQNMNETIEMLCELYKRFDKDANKYINTNSNSKEQSIINIPQHSKKVYLTIEKYLTSVLCQIPGVSTTIASQISEVYSDNLYQFITTAQVSDIAIIKLKSGRKVGVKLASQIIDFIQKEKFEKNI